MDTCKENKDLKFYINDKFPPDCYFGPFYIPEDNEFVSICKSAIYMIGRKPLISCMPG